MTYQNVWWHPNYVEYASGLNPPKTWPNVMEQYRRPNALYDLRYYDLPTENYESMLYYRYPRMGMPVYRGTFRDKPHTVPKYYPEMDPEGKPKGFYGRMYYEQGPPAFKYEGAKKDDLYWLERPPFLPDVPGNKRQSGWAFVPHPPATSYERSKPKATQRPASQGEDYLQSTRKLSQSGVGYL